MKFKVKDQSLAKQLQTNLGRRIIFFDNINVGNGPRVESAKELTILDQALHQWKQINETVGTNTSISIYGISMGGMIASTMATLFPERVKNLVLAATSANLPNNPSVPEDLFNKWTKAKHEDDIRVSTQIAFGRTTLTNTPNIYEEYFQYRIKGKNQQKAKEFIQQLNSVREFDGNQVYSQLSKTDIPVTVLSGAEDTLFNVSHKFDIKSVLTNAEFHEFSNSGHMLHLENLNQLVEILTRVFAAQSFHERELEHES